MKLYRVRTSYMDKGGAPYDSYNVMANSLEEAIKKTTKRALTGEKVVDARIEADIDF